MLIQESLDLNPEWQEVLPPEPVRNEIEPSVSLEELLDGKNLQDWVIMISQNPIT